jgi:GNAT superfamily N-acetyltransferase
VTSTVRAVVDADRSWIRDFVRERWGDETVVAHGVVFRPAVLPGVVVRDGTGDAVGLLTYVIDGDACEVVTIDAVVEGCGYGSLLLETVSDIARGAGCSRLRLTTTNDNERALGFYRSNGFRIAAVRDGAVEASRKLKPSIPLVNEHGVPIRDEIDMEYRLSSDAGDNLPL